MIYSIDKLKEIITPIAEKYRLRSVYLFGSYARGEATDASDVDILIDREGSTVRSLFDMGGLFNDLCEAIGKEVDVVTLQALEQDSSRERSPWFERNVRRDMVLIYRAKEK